MPATRTIIILISIVQSIRHTLIHRCDRQQLAEALLLHNHHQFPAHIVGLHPILWLIFSRAFIIRQFFAEHVQLLCLWHRQHNTKFRPIIRIPPNSRRTMDITCTCKTVVYNCIMVIVMPEMQRIICESKNCYAHVRLPRWLLKEFAENNCDDD